MNHPSTSFMAKVVKNFSPAWFAAVMGTGIFSIASNYYAYYWTWLHNLSVILWSMNIVLFLLLLIPWILRWCLWRDRAFGDLNHPITGQFYATMPIGCSVLAADFLLCGPDYISAPLLLIIAKALWITGALLSLTTAIITPVLHYFNKITIEDINPAWFMPPVSLIVVPIAGTALIPYWSPSLQKILLVLNYGFWGTGFFLFLFMAVICFYRFFVALPLPGALMPTIWIFLGPIGAGTISLLKLSSVSSPFLGSLVPSVINILGLIYWSFGFWWLIAASLITIIYILKRNLPYSLSWWAFTFPLGVYTVATYLISLNLECETIRFFGFLCYCLLAICWLIVFSNTFARVCNGSLFKD